ncbi:hypothetical protein EDD15DRAFT_2373023 [Pisolithus albus]|nr:hypothetical protein EDD15DRAFT_2373023 [Pisolithus albus]
MQHAKAETARNPAATTNLKSDTAGGDDVPSELLGIVDGLEFAVSDDYYDVLETDVPTPTVKKSSPSSLFQNWKAVIPTLVEIFLSYLTRTMGKPIPTPSSTMSHCLQACETKTSVVICLYLDRACFSLVFELTDNV